MKFKRCVGLALLLFCLVGLALIMSGTVNAQGVNDFTITEFKADYTLTRQDPQGELHVIEDINVDFRGYNHGILRAIPSSYKNHKLQMHVNAITSNSGAPTGYTTYGQNGNTVLKIGDPKATITGVQHYRLDYVLHNVITFYNSHDELYWDINGDQWQQPAEKVSVTLHVPNDLKLFSEGPLCFTGGFGSSNKDCTIASSDTILTFQTTKSLPARETLTILVGFEKGYFEPSKLNETLGEYTRQIILFIAPIFLVGGYAIRKWLKWGRDPKGRGTIVPQYDPPDGLKPLAVGAVIDFRADNRDVTAMFIDLAVRGYIKIIEKKKKRVLAKDTLEYSFELRQSDWTGLDHLEKQVMNAIFDTKEVGETIAAADLKNKFYKTAASVRSKVVDDLTAASYFPKNPTTAGGGLFAVAALMFVSIFILAHWLGGAYIAGAIVTILLCILFAALMASRTPKGVAAKEHILGLRLYLETAEKDRLKMLQSPDAKYAPEHDAPVRTVELFEKLLPYAVVLKVEKQWAKQFEDMYTEEPDWYSGNWHTFSAVYLASSLNSSFVGTMNATTFSSPSSSGSSGFGGGGFSGGGGGGGGGGGW